MSFPYDARLRTYSALQQVLSADLNAIQDAIVDCFSRRTKHIFSPFGTNWAVDSGATYLTFKCGTGGTSNWIAQAISFDEDVRLYAVKVKVYVATGTGMTVDLHFQDQNIEDNPTTTPGWGTSDASDDPTGTGWSVRTLTPSSSPHTLGADEMALVLIGDPDVNDEYAGIQVDYEPLTAT